MRFFVKHNTGKGFRIFFAKSKNIIEKEKINF